MSIMVSIKEQRIIGTREAVAQGCSVETFSLKFRKIHTKTPAPELLF